MNTITFATTNRGKLASMQRHFANTGVTLGLFEKEVMEPQLPSVVDIAIYKARQVQAQVPGPVVATDAGFFVDALKGFPGPYVKHFNDTAGNPALMRFMQGERNRAAHFELGLAYIDEQGRIKTFHSKHRGQICETEDDEGVENQWSDLYRLWSPEGTHDPLSVIKREGRESERWQSEPGAFEQLASWLGQAGG